MHTFYSFTVNMLLQRYEKHLAHPTLLDSCQIKSLTHRLPVWRIHHRQKVLSMMFLYGISHPISNNFSKSVYVTGFEKSHL